MKITQEQGRAISARARKLITVAAAGSGKTHVLVHRYLALLDANADWRIPSLVAITFTRAAAREMRERVREHLQTRLSEASAEGEKEALVRPAVGIAQCPHPNDPFIMR